MASFESVKQRMEELITCSECDNILSSPRGLPCLHVFCEGCIQDHLNESDSDETCPLCREDITVPADGVEGLTKSFIHSKLTEVHRLMSG